MDRSKPTRRSFTGPVIQVKCVSSQELFNVHLKLLQGAVRNSQDLSAGCYDALANVPDLDDFMEQDLFPVIVRWLYTGKLLIGGPLE